MRPQTILSLAFAGIVVALLFLTMSSAIDPGAGWKDPRELATGLTFGDIGSCKAKEQLEDVVRSAIRSASSCSSDDHCVLKNFGCPFGCRVAVNNTNIEQVKMAVLEYKTYLDAGACGRCVYRCSSNLNPAALCIEGECRHIDLGEPEKPDVYLRYIRERDA